MTIKIKAPRAWSMDRVYDIFASETRKHAVLYMPTRKRRALRAQCEKEKENAK